MINKIDPVFGFIFIFSILAILKLILYFIKVFFSDKPEPFGLNNLETLIYGLFVSYIITFLIY